jgi:hypothetical protein
MITVIEGDLKKNFLAVWSVILLIFLMLGDIFFIKDSNDFIFILLTVLWFWLNRYFKLEIKVSLAVGLFFLALCPFFMLFSGVLAERAGIWAFLLILAATVLSALEN